MKWLLPQGIEDVPASRAELLETARRRVLDIFISRGYDLVEPPIVEFLESLLTGAASDLRDYTLQVTDPLSGRQLGIRPDITPQIARIDATRGARRGDVRARYCYAGTVLTARARAIDVSRTPFQVGVELFGHSGLESDVEVILLMLAMLRDLGVPVATLGLSHVGVFHGMCEQAGLTTVQELQLQETLERKAHPDIGTLLMQLDLPVQQQGWFQALADLHGGHAVLQRARDLLTGAGEVVQQALRELEDIAEKLMARLPGLPLYFDLGELRGYHYHTGVVYGAYVAGEGQAIAGGGRYDGIGDEFGNARAATGFSADLKKLVACGALDRAADCAGWVLVPWCDDEGLRDLMGQLIGQGYRLVNELPGAPSDPRCDRRLVKRGEAWTLETIETGKQ